MAEQSNPVLIAVGRLLVVLGGVWLLLSGGCTVVFIGQALMGAFSHDALGPNDPADMQMMPLILLFGAAGIIPGAGILWGGLAILRRQRKKD
jgi:hypothetical protein